MSKPLLNHVSVIKRSQIRKRCRNTNIIGGISLVNQLDLDYRTDHLNLSNKEIPAGTQLNQHSDLRERQRFVVHGELRRLLRRQTVKTFLRSMLEFLSK